MLTAAYRISLVSLVFTLVAGSCAIAVGALAGSLVLVTFGAIGLLDAIGSATLIVHFRHALHRDALSARHEGIAMAVVTIGMAAIGLATMADSAYRLATKAGGGTSIVGIVIAGVSVIVLAALARGKHRIAPHVPSPALRADGWVSALGAMLALVTLLGTALQKGLGWWWLDPTAAIAVASGALVMSVLLRREAMAD
ncbi:MAG: cation transporter [Acidimicrobiales bacterium]